MTATPTETAAPPVIVSRAKAQHLVLEHAARVELPMPHITVAYECEERLTFQIPTLDELAVWSLYLEEPISGAEHAGPMHHVVVGTVLEVPVRLVAITGGAS